MKVKIFIASFILLAMVVILSSCAGPMQNISTTNKQAADSTLVALQKDFANGGSEERLPPPAFSDHESGEQINVHKDVEKKKKEEKITNKEKVPTKNKEETKDSGFLVETAKKLGSILLFLSFAYLASLLPRE